MATLRLGKRLTDGALVAHFVDVTCKTLRLATRGSYATEVLASTSALDDVFSLAIALEEMHRGRVSPS